ncbi:28S rRNA (cytosine-C(5))-methyltransferase isoform X2 [Toxorhynchites rutilus septentrionalis]|uniref:28S rRNA (cytosine-C(5))-methyltransferase isoform X2 n=1 Tax=Toxorhynchites rutilus septentrionalis TaxID=329112 RepID=UPI0024784629|nr:28S rRNA (cytosine-C(5))-methyltransferase isoform X2 [Toxorhynchites rutilus septentrionalis]XP_055617017.1 28S rRNA (cytosine-C(5))-methyltransferase isoform X2 [Toxorhynchites rutilus septentrionalis]
MGKKGKSKAALNSSLEESIAKVKITKQTLEQPATELIQQSPEKKPRYVRINTNAIAQPGALRLLQEEGWILIDEEFVSYADYLERVKSLGDSEFLVDFHFKEVLVFPNSAKNYWARATELKQKFVLQNKACLLPTRLLNPPKKCVVLDMCAAPGLKTTHLANLMKNKGRIYAVERDATRYKLLCEYAADFGVIKTLNEDCLLVGDEQAPGVEYILIDPSCSGSGMVSRLKLNEETDKQRLYKLGGLQYKLLCHAMNAFPAAKRIVYSTCSIYPEENEEIVQGALKHNGHFKLVDAKALLGMEWLNFGSADYAGIGEKCLYSRPESDLTIGMFVAVFERCEGEEEYNEVYMAHEKQKESYDKLSRIGQAGFGKGRGKDKKKREVKQLKESGQDIKDYQETELDVDENEHKSEKHEAEMELTQNNTKKKKKKHKNLEVSADVEECEAKLPSDRKEKRMKSQQEQDMEENGHNIETKFDEMQSVDDFDIPKKKKKKNKKNEECEQEQIKLETSGTESIGNDAEKTKSKEKNFQANTAHETCEATENSQPLESDQASPKKKKKRKHDNEISAIETGSEIPENSLEDGNISKKKKKKKSGESVVDIEMVEQTDSLAISVLPNKSKKKKKRNKDVDTDNV